MKVFVVTTSNEMTTSYYYSLLEKAFRTCSLEVIKCTEDRLKNYDIDKKNDMILCGGAAECVRIYFKGYKKIATWFQGVVPEERKMQGCSSFRVFVMSAVEFLALRISVFNIYVSNTMIRHFRKKYHFNVNKTPYIVMPCFNETGAYADSFEPNVKNPYSFVYAGGLGVWQCFEQSLRVYKMIEEKLPQATLSILTNQVEKVCDMLSDYNLNNVSVKYSKPEDLHNELKNKMYGFVLRDDNPVNNVATPTKLSTYVSNGVIPICSSCVGDFTEVTKNDKYVIHVDKHDDETIVETILANVDRININYLAEMHKKECEHLFSDYYSSESYIAKIKKLIMEKMENFKS